MAERAYGAEFMQHKREMAAAARMSVATTVGSAPA
jgi:hypothetical protein